MTNKERGEEFFHFTKKLRFWGEFVEYFWLE